MQQPNQGTSKPKLRKLEAVRGLAAIYVVFHHSFGDSKGSLSFLLRFGQEAVILFFLLSGFVIDYAFQQSTDKSFRLYFFKRFFRIYIPLIIVFALNICVLKIQYDQVQISIKELLGNLLMLQDVPSLKPGVICKPFLGNSPLWSLSYEWWFYMLFFVLLRFFKNNARIIIYSVGICAALSYLWIPVFVNRELMYMVIWYLGAEMADCYLKNGKIHLFDIKYGLLAISTCIAILGVNIFLNHAQLKTQLGISGIGISPFLEFRHFAFALITILVAFLWQRFDWRFWNYTVAPFEVFANISFGIYITHWFLVAKATYLNFIPFTVLRFFLYFLICFACSFVIERVIYLKLNKKLLAILFNNKVAMPIKEN